MTVDFADGRTFKAKLVGSDEASDLAVIKIDASNLQTLALGNSELAQVGDVVLAVGNPLGVGETVTMGIISAKGRQTDTDQYQDFIQTDAPINQGNSGGALVNLKGELIGINSQILSPSQGNIGLGFAIPVNMARHVMDDLRKDGHVRRAQLGVTIQPMTADLAQSLGLKEAGGAIVSSVAAGSAAEHAGVKRGDVIKSFNGQAVQDINSLRNRVAETAPGSSELPNRCTPARSIPALKISELRASACAVSKPPYDSPQIPTRFGSTSGLVCRYLPPATTS